MSLVKSNAVQIGQSVTASNNFTLYQPSTPDGTVRLGNGNSGSATDLVTLTSAGNLGIGTSSPSSFSGFHYLSIDGTSGSVVNLRSNGTSQLEINTTTTDNNISGLTALPLIFKTNASERMRLDSSGNLGLGVTPSGWGGNYKAIQLPGGSVESYTTSSINLVQNAYDSGAGAWKYLTTAAATYYSQTLGGHYWLTAPSGTAGNAISFTQAMTLDASGNLLVGTTSNISSGYKLVLNYGGTSWGAGPYNGAGNNFYVSNSSNVGVYLASGNTSWTANSDERLKDIIEPIENAVTKVVSLRAVIGKYKTDEADMRRAFLIAQDVQAVLPEAVDSSDPDKLGVQYTDTIPLLVAAIKELSAELNELKAKVNA